MAAMPGESFSAKIASLLKLLRKLDRTLGPAGLFPRHSGDPAGLYRMQPAFLFPADLQLQHSQLLMSSAFIFNDSDLWSTATMNAVATGGG
ncbi:hypothetical protein [Mesorhizobium sp. WSM3866]|uniref:hypothetical protein n=1 Tax=Mesorhizobium sp. WSM3866 TaxID=422271 RepID=UPI001140D51C|nr:hypothetical protein [Mesorhizobium sp. WSM3866]